MELLTMDSFRVDFDHQPAAGKNGPARLSCSHERRDGAVERRAAVRGAGGCAAGVRVRGLHAGDAVWVATGGHPPDASRGPGPERAPRLLAVVFPTPDLSVSPAVTSLSDRRRAA